MAIIEGKAGKDYKLDGDKNEQLIQFVEQLEKIIIMKQGDMIKIEHDYIQENRKRDKEYYKTVGKEYCCHEILSVISTMKKEWQGFN